MHDALSNLIRCKELQERALYRSNKDLTATYDMLAKCYATLGITKMKQLLSTEYLKLHIYCLHLYFSYGLILILKVNTTTVPNFWSSFYQ